MRLFFALAERTEYYDFKEEGAAEETESRVVPVLYFAGTFYGGNVDLTRQDLRMPENDRVEILQSDLDGVDCLLERLQMEKAERSPIVVRAK